MRNLAFISYPGSWSIARTFLKENTNVSSMYEPFVAIGSERFNERSSILAGCLRFVSQ